MKENNTLIEDSLIALPVWEEDVWNALQRKQYTAATDALANLLHSFTPDERKEIDWKALFYGVPAVRGELTETEWVTSVRPSLMKEFLEIATGRMIADILNSSEPNERIVMFLALVSAIPGESLEEKERWLARQKSSSFIYFLATPAQCFDARTPDLDQHVPPSLATQKFSTLPEALQNAIFSYDTADTIYRTSTENLLNSPKIRAATRAAGHVLLGFVDPAEIADEVRRASIIDERTSGILAREFRSRIFSKLFSDIEDAYEPPEDFKASANKVFGASTLASLTPRISLSAPFLSPQVKTGNAPFLLHEEKTTTEEARKESMKGFSLPFGLFKPKQSEFAKTPRATVEAPSFAKATAGKPKKEEEKRVVHYSEYRTNLAPATGEFINLETFGVKTRMSTNKEESTNITNGTSKSAAKTPVTQLPSYPVTSPYPPITPSSDRTDKSGMTDASNIPIKKMETPAPPSSPKQSPQVGGTPKVEGNVVDLR